MSTRNRFILGILIADVLVMGLVFSVSGFYNRGVDTFGYVQQIEHFSNPEIPLDQSAVVRDFKPFYGIFGAFLVPVVDPETAILILNVSFLIGLSILFFLFLKIIGFQELPAFIGTLWLIFGYPLLKYGLALGTDISGWFFAVLAAYVGYYGIISRKFLPLILASVFGFIGFLSKETGVLGLGFVGLSLLFTLKRESLSFFLKQLISLSLPFLILEGWYMGSIVSRGGVTFFDWYKINAEGIQSYQTFFYLFWIEGSTFSILLLFGLVAIFFAIKTKEIFAKKWLSIYLPLFVVSLPVFMWPIYISRIMYVQFLFVIPLALYGSEKVLAAILNENKKKIFAFSLAILPIVLSITLFLIARNQSLFDVFSL